MYLRHLLVDILVNYQLLLSAQYRPTYQPIVTVDIGRLSLGQHIGRHIDGDLADMSNKLRIFQYLYYCYLTSDQSTLNRVTSDILCNILEGKK